MGTWPTPSLPHPAANLQTTLLEAVAGTVSSVQLHIHSPQARESISVFQILDAQVIRKRKMRAICMNEGTAVTGASSMDAIWANSTAHCPDVNANNVELGCVVAEPAGLVTVQTVTGADYTNSTVTATTTVPGSVIAGPSKLAGPSKID